MEEKKYEEQREVQDKSRFTITAWFSGEKMTWRGCTGGRLTDMGYLFTTPSGSRMLIKSNEMVIQEERE